MGKEEMQIIKMEIIDILISTILLRPYVFVLLGFYLIAGDKKMVEI